MNKEAWTKKAQQEQREKTETVQPKKDHHVKGTNKPQSSLPLTAWDSSFVGMHMYPLSFIVCSFVRSCMRPSSYHKREIINRGSKSRRPTKARQGQREREKRNSPNQDHHHVERNKQTTIKACHLHPEIHHSWVCTYPLSSCVRSCVRSFVRLFVHASVIISQREKERRRE